ncbi:cytochrome-c peroxidase [Algoriphagus vanfongensis]|uniref:cytochrome-c peroxidase n=1 Tax=Algoriphagus vanfongensis TaxID=426371 RepID=UPI0004089BD0|nr:cytochrome c peroxidase [Algoriphagus vanfongensis]
MKKAIAWVLSSGLILFCVSWSGVVDGDPKTMQELREIYEGPIENWPKPELDSGIAFHELGLLPDNPFRNVDSLKPVIELGKMLFFDPRLSSSNQISCSSCHDPEFNWSNGRSVALGHDQQEGRRNSMSLENSWMHKDLFWDGRVGSLEDQAAMPIQDSLEMHSDLGDVVEKISEIAAYQPYFEDAFPGRSISQETITSALAYFQRSLTSRKSDFDYFLDGKHDRMSDQQIRGLHLFRTKARCMNCHNGPNFTDEEFHNLGLHYYGRKLEDLGRYNVSHDPKDIGKFRTPSLRNVMETGPWMHNGIFDNMDGILNMYNAGMARPKPRPGLENDPNFPVTSDLLIQLQLTQEEKDDIIAFLEAISAPSFRMQRPSIPN